MIIIFMFAGSEESTSSQSDLGVDKKGFLNLGYIMYSMFGI